MINQQIYVTSASKAAQNAKYTGKLDFKIIQLFNLYKYYIDFAQGLSDNGSDQFKDIIISLKKEAAKLQYKYPNIICNYKVVTPNDVEDIGQTIVNTAPTASNKLIDIEDASSYKFTLGDFISDFSDAENHLWKFLLIYPGAGIEGELSNNSQIFSKPRTLDIEGLALDATLDLTYLRLNTDIYSGDVFSFRVSDDPVNYLYSTLYTMTIDASQIDAIAGNQPPADIGDNTIYADNRAITVLTLAMFTSGLQPPYNDPEGDLIDAIRIVDISNANLGVYKVNGVDITEGQIITREDINGGLFTHEAPNQDAINSDVFEFEARDEGSGIWVG